MRQRARRGTGGTTRSSFGAIGYQHGTEGHCTGTGTVTGPQIIYQQSTGSTNGLAIASLVCGLVWIFGVTSVLAIVFGFPARTQIDESRGARGGRGMAVADIVLGFIGVGALIIYIIAVLVLAHDVSTFNQTPNQ